MGAGGGDTSVHRLLSWTPSTPTIPSPSLSYPPLVAALPSALPRLLGVVSVDLCCLVELRTGRSRLEQEDL